MTDKSYSMTRRAALLPEGAAASTMAISPAFTFAAKRCVHNHNN
ncbi:Hypothetical protein NGAL_HAMBI2605_60630 [Neorhizobium galegae bv. orientalis]|nr:Hypothetical protein NGAL_HAMBI2605_60630 [Neorhizobium galegae bv. orientalis]